MMAGKECLISIVGTGRVAWNLSQALKASGYTIQEVSGRNIEKIHLLAQMLDAHAVENPSGLNPQVDLIILAVNDDAIEDVSSKLPETKGIVVHTSGMSPMSNISNKCLRQGVFYPLQTFSFDRYPNFDTIPVMVQANDKSGLEMLRTIAASISKNVVLSDDHQRQTIHLAAVFVNNFTNTLYGIADDILQDKGLSIKILQPLIVETANKILDHKPSDVQTGPARRNDMGTIQKHLIMLSDSVEKREIYQFFTEYILNKYHPETNE